MTRDSFEIVAEDMARLGKQQTGAKIQSGYDAVEAGDPLVQIKAGSDSVRPKLASSTRPMVGPRARSHR